MALKQKWQQTILLAAGILTFTAAANAGFLDKLNFFKNWSATERVDTLMITGNYAKSRLLAELVQHKTEQPILLLSPGGSGNMEMYFLPSAPEAMALQPEDYVEFVEFLQPKRIIVIGNEKFVPSSYYKTLQDKFPTVIVASEDWLKNAEALATIFEYKKLEQHYSDYLLELTAASSGRPAAMDDAFGGLEEPVVPPESVVPLQPEE